ncbi:MAG TPA: VanW family protein [Sphingomicrobium sp.]
MASSATTSSETLHAGHSPAATAVFWLKSRGLIARRLLVNLLSARALRRYRREVAIPADARLLARDEHPVYTAGDPREQELELGKVQNLRVAAAAVDGIVLRTGETFSFWAAAGRPGRGKGYVLGRELRQGCMVPSVGGGICQLTNALSRVAHRAGLEIVERHSHTAHPPGFFIDDTTDATVFWNYIDLRFRSPVPLRIGARLTETTLVVRLDALE